MAAPQLSDKALQQALDTVAECGGVIARAAEKLGISRTTLQHRVLKARQALHAKRKRGKGAAAVPALVAPPAPPAHDLEAQATKLLQKRDRSLAEVASALGVTEGTALDVIRGMQRRGLNVLARAGIFSVEKTPLPVERSDDLHTYMSDDRARYRFGFVTDNHLCSKYAREDVLNDLYDLFAREGITRVYNAGNWIDGEARFNKTDLNVHGMTPQVKYFVANYPRRKGITTYYIAGDDHEGWYAKDHGVDIGRYTEQVARDAGRTDLRYMGYMEAWVALRNAKTGAEAKMLVVHPGGGSSYAISYAPQKHIEALQGGEKPAIALFGHWHKMEVVNYRNVWIIQGGTTEDQTPFMRKKRLEAHVGGVLIELRQDDKGALVDCITQQRRYFDRGYYQDQFNPAGPLGPRG